MLVNANKGLQQDLKKKQIQQLEKKEIRWKDICWRYDIGTMTKEKNDLKILWGISFWEPVSLSFNQRQGKRGNNNNIFVAPQYQLTLQVYSK